MSEPETRAIHRLRRVYYVSRQAVADEAYLNALMHSAVATLSDRYDIVGEPTIHVSQPSPPFEFGVDDEGNEYRRPDAVVIEVRVMER